MKEYFRILKEKKYTWRHNILGFDNWHFALLNVKPCKTSKQIQRQTKNKQQHIDQASSTY